MKELIRPKKQPETAGELVRDIQVAVQRMSVKNPHRYLLIRAADMVMSLAMRLAPIEQPEEEKSGVVCL